MTVDKGLRQPTSSDLHLLRSEHGNIARLLLVLESHLALMIMGERFDGAAMLDTVDYLLDYVSEFHRDREERLVAAMAAERPCARSCVATLSARHDALETSGAELYHRLDLAIRDESINRDEVVRLGYAYCTALRRTMSIEEAMLPGANAGMNDPMIARPSRDGEAGYRARFEELTRRIGCECAYGER